MNAKNFTHRHTKVLLSALALAGLSVAPTIQAAPAGTDWLWLSANESACTWTVTVNWAGFKKAKTLEVFLTQTYSGSPLVPTFVPINNNKTGTATVTVSLVPSATQDYFYPWAQLLDSHGVAIPASLDFSGQTLAYCAAP